MISAERAAEFLRLYHAEKWRVGTLARQFGVHHNTVRRVLAQAGQAPGLSPVCPSVVDPFVPLIRATLEKYPTLRASRLYAMVRERGYPGGPDHFRHVVARHRPARVAEAYLRLRTLPGEQLSRRDVVPPPLGALAGAVAWVDECRPFGAIRFLTDWHCG